MLTATKYGSSTEFSTVKMVRLLNMLTATKIGSSTGSCTVKMVRLVNILTATKNGTSTEFPLILKKSWIFG